MGVFWTFLLKIHIFVGITLIHFKTLVKCYTTDIVVDWSQNLRHFYLHAWGSNWGASVTFTRNQNNRWFDQVRNQLPSICSLSVEDKQDCGHTSFMSPGFHVCGRAVNPKTPNLGNYGWLTLPLHGAVNEVQDTYSLYNLWSTQTSI